MIQFRLNLEVSASGHAGAPGPINVIILTAGIHPVHRHVSPSTFPSSSVIN
jgi:hypothetical protein